MIEALHTTFLVDEVLGFIDIVSGVIAPGDGFEAGSLFGADVREAAVELIE